MLSGNCRLKISDCRLNDQIVVFKSAIFNLKSAITRAASGKLVKRALTACRHVVSGSLSSPDRGSSHLSLALLRSLSVAREYLALGDGPPRFRLAFTCQVVLRCRIGRFGLSPTGLSPSMVNHSRLFGWTTRILNTGPTTPPPPKP